MKSRQSPRSERGDLMKASLMSVMLLALFAIILTATMVSGEFGRIDIDHAETPLFARDIRYVEADDDGNTIFVGYAGNGISVIDNTGPSIEHYNTASTPPLMNDNIALMEYDQVGGRLIMLTFDQYGLNLHLEVLDAVALTVNSTPLEIPYLTLYDMVYDPATDMMYIGTSSGLFIFDMGTRTMIWNFDISNGLLADSVVSFCIEPNERALWMLTSDYYMGYIQSLDLDSRQVTEENFTIFEYAYGAGYSPYGVGSFIYDPATEEFYVSFDSLYREYDGHTYYLAYFDRYNPSAFTAINTSMLLEGSPFVEFEGQMMQGNYIESMRTARDGELILFSMGDLGAGVIRCSDHSYRALLHDVNDPVYGTYTSPFLSGGSDIDYSSATDTGYVAYYDGIVYFNPDDLTHPDGTGGDIKTPRAQKVDMTYLYSVEKGEDGSKEGEELDEETRLKPSDILHISAYAPYEGGVSIDHMELKIIKEPGGEVVCEKREEGNMVYYEQDIKDLPTSRYTVMVLAKDAQDNTIYEDESTFYVDNPVSTPIIGSVAGVGIALTASVGAGIAISAIGAGATSAAGGTASSSAAAVSSASSSAAGSSFSWKNLLFGFASEYGEETLKEKTAPKDRFLDLKGSFITKREVVAMLISVIVLVVGFGYVEMMSALAPNKVQEVLGIPLFTIPDLSLMSFFMVVPVVFFTSCLIILSIELVEELSAKMIGLWSEFRIWPIGLFTLLISSLFLMPIGYPGKAVPKGDMKITRRMEAFISSCVLVSILAMMFPFEIAFLLGEGLKGGIPGDLLTSFGLIGITMCVMMFAYSVFPVVPMDGRKIWRYNKFYLIVMLLLGVATFGIWTFRLVPNPIFFLKGDYVIYIPTWLLATIFMGLSSLAMIGLIGLVIIGFTTKNWDDPVVVKKSKGKKQKKKEKYLEE